MKALPPATVKGATVIFAPGVTYTTALDADFNTVAIPIKIVGNGAILNFGGLLGFYNGSRVSDCGIVATGVLSSYLASFDYVQIGATAGIVALGAVRISHCQIAGDITINAGQSLDADYLGLTGIIVANGGECRISNSMLGADSASPAVDCTAGYLFMMGTVVTNAGAGGSVKCENSATTVPNMLTNIFCVTGTITCGDAVSIIGPSYTATALSGSAITRMNTVTA